MVRTGLAVGGAILVLVGGATLAWGGSGIGGVSWGPDQRTERTDPVAGVRSIRIDSGSGDVEIRRAPGAAAEVHSVEERWWNGEQADQQRFRVDGGTLSLRGDCGWNCTVSYVVTLPEAVPVSGTLGSGNLTVHGMDSVETDVSSGDVAIDDIAGDVRARTSSGELTATNVRGRLDVASSSGDVEATDIRSAEVSAKASSGGVTLDLLDPRTVTANTDSGDLSLTVPAGPYRVTSETGSGDEQIDVDQAREAPRHLDLRTGSGNLSVSPR